MSARIEGASERPSWRAVLTPAEQRSLLELRDVRSWGSLAVNWGLVAAAFALVAAWPNPLSVVLAIFVIGGRQLGFAVLMHEAAHRTFLRGQWNDRIGNWLSAYPVWGVLHPYRPYHLQHHAQTWADFLASFGVPHLRTPADMRLGEATGDWVAATGGIR